MTVSKYSTTDPNRMRRYLQNLNFYTARGVNEIMGRVEGLVFGGRPYEDTFIKVTLKNGKWMVVEK